MNQFSKRDNKNVFRSITIDIFALVSNNFSCYDILQIISFVII